MSNEPPAKFSSTAVLRELGMRPSKGLGQNFLVDESVPPKILQAAEVGPSDCVVEVGPGVGVLTWRLLEAAKRVTAVELDNRLYPYLREKFAAYPNGSRLVEGDVLDFAPTILEPEPYKLVANIPYYITSAILRHFLESSHPPTRVVLMVQKEVADRIVARPGDMSLLALSVQFYGAPKRYAIVPAGAFYPPPKVDSAILLIEVYPPALRPLPDVTESRFFEVARAGFGQKRKQLANSLAAGLKLDKAVIYQALAQSDILPTARAEELTLPQWGALCQTLPT